MMERRSRRISSSLLPENIGPQITSIQPRLPVTKSISGDAHASARTIFAHHVGVLDGFGVALDSNGGDRVVRSGGGEAAEPGAEAILIELQGLAADMKPRGLHAILEAADGHRIAGPVVNVHVQRVAL